MNIRNRAYFFIILILLFVFYPGSGHLFAHAGDFHFHLASEEIAEIIRETAEESYPGNIMEKISGAAAIEELDRAGMEKGFILSYAYILGTPEIDLSREYCDVKKENNFLALEVARYPDRLFGFFSVNPLKPYSLLEISRCVKLLNLPGLKLHFKSSNIDLRNEYHLNQVKKVFQHAADLEIPVILHFRNRSPDFGREDAEIFINEIIAQIPGLKIQISHLGGWGGFDRPTEEVFRTFINAFEENPGLDKSRIFMDISGVIIGENQTTPGGPGPTSLLERWKVAEMLREWGLDQVVFGSNWPWVSPEKYVEIIREKLPLTQWEINSLLENSPVESLFGEEVPTPNLNILNLFLQEGVDYKAPYSINY